MRLSEQEKTRELVAARKLKRERQRQLDEQFYENHQRCFHCNAYTDECECDGGIT